MYGFEPLLIYAWWAQAGLDLCGNPVHAAGIHL